MLAVMDHRPVADAAGIDRVRQDIMQMRASARCRSRTEAWRGASVSNIWRQSTSRSGQSMSRISSTVSAGPDRTAGRPPAPSSMPFEQPFDAPPTVSVSAGSRVTLATTYPGHAPVPTDASGAGEIQSDGCAVSGDQGPAASKPDGLGGQRTFDQVSRLISFFKFKRKLHA